MVLMQEIMGKLVGGQDQKEQEVMVGFEHSVVNMLLEGNDQVTLPSEDGER